MSYSVEDTGDAIVVANPLPWSTRLLEILLRLALISLLMDTAWKKLTLDPETYTSIVPYLNEPP